MSQLPNYGQAVVPVEKIRDYLLNEAHADGGPKAVFFKRFGFRSDAWQTLAKALLHIAHTGQVSRVQETIFCTKFLIKATLETPDGRNPIIETIWKINHGEEIPNFVTAYPY